jgi:hypothetical protein
MIPCYCPRSMTVKCILQQTLLSGFSGRKAPSSMGKIGIPEVLRLRAVSPLLSDMSARRFAQDDDSVGGLMEPKPLCGSQGAPQVLGCARDDKWRVVTLIRAVRSDGQKETAGPSTTLRSGRDDNFVQNSKTSREKSIKSQPLRMTTLWG